MHLEIFPRHYIFTNRYTFNAYKRHFHIIDIRRYCFFPFSEHFKWPYLLFAYAINHWVINQNELYVHKCEITFMNESLTLPCANSNLDDLLANYVGKNVHLLFPFYTNTIFQSFNQILWYRLSHIKLPIQPFFHVSPECFKHWHPIQESLTRNGRGNLGWKSNRNSWKKFRYLFLSLGMRK